MAIRSFDVIIVGAGPIGLALAVELARRELSTLVVDRRPEPPDDPQLRRQLLVARRGDLAHLAHLGIDLRDPWLVSPLATRCEADLASGRVSRGEVHAIRGVPSRPLDLRALAAEPPMALVPIGRLQQALLSRARGHGATVHYGCEVLRLRRHATTVSMTLADGSSVRGTVAILATGSARALIAGDVRATTPARKLIGGVFAIAGRRGRWVRVELPLPRFALPARCTMLQTSTATEGGTAMIVDPQLGAAATPEQLAHVFDHVARVQGLAGVPYLFAPQPFVTSVTTMARRVVGGDNRAPIVVAGDAAQTGHVFSGQTCFINLALAVRLGESLIQARDAIEDQQVNDPELVRALARYEAESAAGAEVLAGASERHYAMGSWALAGVAQA